MPTLRSGTVPDLLAAVQAANPSRPRLTWYGPAGERIELSARTLANWVNKAANLLVEELDVEPGALVAIVRPWHWKTLVVAAAALSAGAEVRLVESAQQVVDADLLVSTSADQPAGAGGWLLVEPAALARSYTATLPSGAVDFAAEVTGQDDVFIATAPLALGPVTALTPQARVLLRTDDGDALHVLLAALAADGSVVLAVPETAQLDLAGEAAHPVDELTVPA
ncbi:MAG: TIGR03089 family protein [Actinomycetales bacterium]